MSKQFSTVRSDHIEYAFWLTFDGAGGVRFSRGKPALDRNEKAISCTANLPRSLFREPELKVEIAVPHPETEPLTINIVAASDALRSALGVDIDLRVNVQGDEQ